jgi:hypothetical protein
MAPTRSLGSSLLFRPARFDRSSALLASALWRIGESTVEVLTLSREPPVRLREPAPDQGAFFFALPPAGGCALEKNEYTYPLRRSRRSLVIEYQLRIIGTDGRLRRTIGLLCLDDESAKDYAREVVHGHDIELWQGERRVKRFKVAPE